MSQVHSRVATWQTLTEETKEPGRENGTGTIPLSPVAVSTTVVVLGVKGTDCTTGTEWNK